MANLAMCEPAYTVVCRLGGDLNVSRALGIRRDAVWRWHAPRNRQGTGGKIPRKRHAPLLKYAESLGVPLTESDLTGDQAELPERVAA